MLKQGIIQISVQVQQDRPVLVVPRLDRGIQGFQQA